MLLTAISPARTAETSRESILWHLDSIIPLLTPTDQAGVKDLRAGIDLKRWPD